MSKFPKTKQQANHTEKLSALDMWKAYAKFSVKGNEG